MVSRSIARCKAYSDATVQLGAGAVGDQERTVAFYLPSNEAEVGLGGGSKGKDLFVRLVCTAGAANQPWIGFVPFGQVAIHTVKLTGKITHRGQ